MILKNPGVQSEPSVKILVNPKNILTKKGKFKDITLI